MPVSTRNPATRPADRDTGVAGLAGWLDWTTGLAVCCCRSEGFRARIWCATMGMSALKSFERLTTFAPDQPTTRGLTRPDIRTVPGVWDTPGGETKRLTPWLGLGVGLQSYGDF